MTLDAIRLARHDVERHFLRLARLVGSLDDDLPGLSRRGLLFATQPFGQRHRIAGLACEGAWIAVLHSGAGAFAPALAEAAPGLAGFVFVDAVLPYPGKTCLQNAPDWLAETLA